MKRNTFGLAIALGAATALLAPLSAPAQTVTLYGTIVGGASHAPVRLAKVYLKGTHGTIGPVLTDANGAFAFIDAPAGTYTLQVYTGSGTSAVFTETVTVPGRLPPIQL